MSVPITRNDRVILITGASRGIGRATALLAAHRGYSVAINYRANADAAQTLSDELSAIGTTHQVIQADIARADDITRLFKTVDDTLGRLDVLVNNAGILEQTMRLDQMSAQRIERILTTNVSGTILCCKEAVLRMSTMHNGHGGSIINVSSRAAVLGAPKEYIDYAASKGAVDTLTVGLAKEVASEGIRVNAVRPGLIETDIHASGGNSERVAQLKHKIPLKRGGQAREVADAILWLASDKSTYTTGAFLDVSGGV